MAKAKRTFKKGNVERIADTDDIAQELERKKWKEVTKASGEKRTGKAAGEGDNADAGRVEE
ncbi:MAG: hypothetical protein K2N01_12750 [Lachnospiraceae bacterium]|nr:hypothetical protein [Lachnospiraceae bacterium]